ncbi:DUF3307 domain-containing protein [bacterium]|nr:DUF3307 domain-containing protein [bacterium]
MNEGLFQFEIIVSLLFLKHFLFDYVLQSKAMLLSKHIYGRWSGILHAIAHGAGTFFVLSITSLTCALFFAVLDTVIHYHIDWIRGRYGSKDVTSDCFWVHIGLDQLAHGFTYIAITSVVVHNVIGFNL